MKSTLKLTLGALALSLAQQAAADVTVRLTGSTAFRSGTHKAIVAMMGGEANCKFAHGAIVGSTTATQTSYEGADYTTIQGTASGISGITTVQCSWTGSATGVKDVAQGNNLSFVPTTALPASNGYANAAVAQSPTQTATAKYAFSDVFQSSTATTTPALTDTIMAVIPFSWVANRLSTGFTNMTQQGARALFTNGFQPKSLFTGNAADADYILPVGRDIGSGTRITCLAEIKYGVNTPVQQWKITSSGSVGSGNIVSAQLWPVGDGIGSATPGNGGYTSGSTIRNFFGMTSTASGAYLGVNLIDQDGNTVANDLNVTLVSWLGVSDVATAVTNGAVRLAYEGVTYDGSNKGLIYNGRYTAWGYLHCYTPGGLNTDEVQFRTNLSTQLDNESVIGASGLRSSQMLVTRTADGAVVGP
ncbi:MAG: hypothetical protein NTX35_21955 [Verrucomicrobia bacterium]|nr:hypothetical protein [Verrucomicrobiota bacterium]